MTWLLLSAGRGPAECQIAVRGFLDVLMAEAAAAKIRAEVIDTEDGSDGPLSVLVSLTGDGADGFAKEWEGTLRWTCPSPLRRGWPRKNWFVGASVLSPPPDTSPLRLSDVTITTMRASGPGGQHVNKTESAVRAVHRPTGLSTVAREERSQHRNKELALARLAAMLAGDASQADADAKRLAWNRHDSLERGNPARTYAGSDFRRTG